MAMSNSSREERKKAGEDAAARGRHGESIVKCWVTEVGGYVAGDDGEDLDATDILARWLVDQGGRDLDAATSALKAMIQVKTWNVDENSQPPSSTAVKLGAWQKLVNDNQPAFFVGIGLRWDDCAWRRVGPARLVHIDHELAEEALRAIRIKEHEELVDRCDVLGRTLGVKWADGVEVADGRTLRAAVVAAVGDHKVYPIAKAKNRDRAGLGQLEKLVVRVGGGDEGSYLDFKLGLERAPMNEFVLHEKGRWGIGPDRQYSDGFVSGHVQFNGEPAVLRLATGELIRCTVRWSGRWIGIRTAVLKIRVNAGHVDQMRHSDDRATFADFLAAARLFANASGSVTLEMGEEEPFEFALPERWTNERQQQEVLLWSRAIFAIEEALAGDSTRHGNKFTLAALGEPSTGILGAVDGDNVTVGFEDLSADLLGRRAAAMFTHHIAGDPLTIVGYTICDGTIVEDADGTPAIAIVPRRPVLVLCQPWEVDGVAARHRKAMEEQASALEADGLYVVVIKAAAE